MQPTPFDTFFRKVFIDWINYTDDERKTNKEALKKVCPHTHITMDYIECGAEGNGIQIIYCELCLFTFQ